MELKVGVFVLYHPAEMDKDCEDPKGKGLPAIIVDVVNKGNLPNVNLRVFNNQNGALPFRANVPHASNKLDYLNYYTYDDKN